MRKIMILASLVLIARLGFAQSFAPIGAKWHIKTSPPPFGLPVITGYKSFEIVKDTTINNILTKKVKIISRSTFIGSSDLNYDGVITTTIGQFMRLNGSKSEIKLNPNVDFWTTIYDSTWTLNSTCSLNFANFGFSGSTSQATIIDTGTIIVNNKKLKWSKIKLMDMTGEMRGRDTATYYKNIGSKHGFNSYFNDGLFDGAFEYLNCYNDNNISWKILDVDCDYFNIQIPSSIHVDTVSKKSILVSNPNIDNCIYISGMENENFDAHIYNSMSVNIPFSKSNVSNNKIKLCLQDAAKGLYFLKFTNNPQTFKVILQ